MTLFFTILTIAYLLFVLILLYGWETIPFYFIDKNIQSSTKITVIIPVRNEEQSIATLLRLISDQYYSMDLLEVIVVDDFSTDQTIQRVQELEQKVKYKLRLLTMPVQYSSVSNKKRAIEYAIEQSEGELIVTTDGDCRPGNQWLGCIEQFYLGGGYKMICGPVVYAGKGTIFSEMQRIEFASLIGSGAASLSMGFPTMCNGANLIYEKEAFKEVGGFEGNADIASGDDEFLMHKMHARYPGKVVFLKSDQAIVVTDPQPDITSFINQRKRWASKWSYYKNPWPKGIAVFVFSINLSIIATALLALTGQLPGVVFLEQFLIKILVEFVFLRRLTAFSGKNLNMISYIILELIYPFYVVFMALSGLRKGYRWKGRIVQ